jgi:hypothetical protein
VSRGKTPKLGARSGSEATATFTVQSDSLIRDVAFVAIGIEIALVLLDVVINFARPQGHGSIRRLFNITREDALPAWFATTQTLLIAVTLCVIWILVKHRGGSPWSRRGWLGLSVFFLYMAIDDGAKVHERVGTALGDFFQSGPKAERSWVSRVVDLFPSYDWQLFVLPIFVAVGVGMLFFLWRELNEKRSRMLLLAALGCLAVAVGLDFIEGLDEDHAWNVHAHLDRWLELDTWAESWFQKSGFDAVVHFSKAVEEFLEMLANTLFWVVFLRHLLGLYAEVRLRLA